MEVPAHLTIKTDGIDFAALLSEWQWLLKEECAPLLMTSFGDLFLRDQQGRIYFLDLMIGKLEMTATTEEEFQQLCQNRETRRQWFMSHLVIELRKLCGELGANECYGCKVPLSLGGKLEASNFERTDISVHYSVLGQLHQQTSRMAPGTKISAVNISSSN